MKDARQLIIQPFIRILFLVSCIAGACLIDQPVFLAGFYVLVILPLFYLNGALRKNLNLLVFGMVPIFLSFVLLYVLVSEHSNDTWGFIILKSLRLLVITSSLQFFLSIPKIYLLPTFRAWGLKGQIIITVLGTFTVWEDIQFRAGKIIEARFARGFITKRTAWQKAIQLPHILVPLIIGIFRTSVERAESWEQKKILVLVGNLQPAKLKFPVSLNCFLIFASLAWITLTLIYHFK